MRRYSTNCLLASVAACFLGLVPAEVKADDSRIDILQRQLDMARQRLDVLREQYTNALGQVRELDQRRADARDRIEDLRRGLREAEAARDRERAEIERLRRMGRRVSIVSPTPAERRVRELSRATSDAQRTLEVLNRQAISTRSLVLRLRDQINLWHDRVADLRQQLEDAYAAADPDLSSTPDDPTPLPDDGDPSELP